MRRRGDEVVIQFEYAKGLVKAVKSLDKRSFDSFSKEWVVPIHLYMDAMARFEAVGAHVELDDELASMYDKTLVPPPRKPEVTISRVGEDYVVQFDYDPELVKAAKRIPGRTFDPSSKAWFIPIEDEFETLSNVAKTFELLECSIRLEPKLRSIMEAPTPLP